MNAVRRIVVSTTFTAVAMLSLAACSDSPLSSPGRLSENLTGRTAGPSGLEQRLTARVDQPQIGSSYTAMLTVTSTIVNTGSAPVALTARECFVQEADVETTAQMNRFEPLISCGAVSSTRTLAPGETSSTLQVQFGVRSGAGNYTLKLRHALSPEFRGEVSFRIP